MLPVEHTHRLNEILLFPKGLIVDDRLLQFRAIVVVVQPLNRFWLTSEPTKRLIA